MPLTGFLLCCFLPHGTQHFVDRASIGSRSAGVLGQDVPSQSCIEMDRPHCLAPWVLPALKTLLAFASSLLRHRARNTGSTITDKILYTCYYYYKIMSFFRISKPRSGSLSRFQLAVAVSCRCIYCLLYISVTGTVNIGRQGGR